MGGPNATRSVEEGAVTPVWLATLPDGRPSGQHSYYEKSKLVDKKFSQDALGRNQIIQSRT